MNTFNLSGDTSIKTIYKGFILFLLSILLLIMSSATVQTGITTTHRILLDTDSCIDNATVFNAWHISIITKIKIIN